MYEIQYSKDIGKFEHQNNINVNIYGYENKKSFHYALLLRPLQDIPWIYYISLLVKNLITYWLKTWPDWCWDNMIMTATKDISANIVWIVAPVKWYWKNKWKNASLTGRK